MYDMELGKFFPYDTSRPGQRARFPEPSPLVRRYDKWLDGKSHGKGSEYAYVYPAVVKVA
jgi:hypothetical protein